ncbi:hypothetical protein FQR65_LT18698 [Abscondita terminalis]|nr:hypothetical protein FQR65_LT18698 [Abscondita terminalis]
MVVFGCWLLVLLTSGEGTTDDITDLGSNTRQAAYSSGETDGLIRSPIYCGLIPVKLNSGECDLVKGTHDPIISEALFYEVQRIITTKRKVNAKDELLKTTFFLRGVLECPYCKRKLSGSFQGSQKG